MKPSFLAALLALSVAAFTTLAGAPQPSRNSHLLRLRSEVIQTPEPGLSVMRATAGPEPQVQGLYLIQFTNRYDFAWRDPLAARGATLVRYVPDDGFIVHIKQGRLNELRALPFIRWIGPFEQRHKVHPAVSQRLATQAPGTALAVKVMVSPTASRLEVAALSRAFIQATPHRSPDLGTILTGRIAPARMARLVRSPLILWIELAPKMKLFDEVSTKIVAGDPDTPGTLANVHELGFDGRDVIVSVADSGLDSGDVNDMHPDLFGRVEALFAYDGLPDASDEHSHGTHCAGIVAGNAASGDLDESGYFWGLGVAPGARIVGQRIFDGGGDYRPPPSYARLTQDAVRSGAYVGSNSWGDDTHGQYDISAAEFDALVRDADPDLPGEQPYVLEFSAGNAGPGGQTIGSPAVGKNVIATGATQNNRFEFPIYGDGQEVMADFSSRGPCEDGRIKPDITAPGTWIASLRSIYADDNNAWGPISDLYLYQGGTSQAGPHASGACAIVIQWYRQMNGGATPSPALVKAMLINSAEDMATAEIPDNGGIGGDPGDGDLGGDTIVVGDTGPVPNNDEGWGRIDLENLIDSTRRYSFTDQGDGLRTGLLVEKRFVLGPDEPLKVTLTYTDFPALPAAIPALVNDLDLEVVSPDGLLYRGNAFSEGESVAGTPDGDRINNVEAVHLSSPTAGEWTVRVRAVNVVQDVHRRTSGPAEQDFALVVSGQMPLPGEGVISWDRDGYRAPAVATIRLVDADLANQSTVPVQVSSGRESAGLTVVLNRSGNAGSFVGTVILSTNAPVANDGQLSVADGDSIAVSYTDARPSGVRKAVSSIDSAAPAISGVVTRSEFGHQIVQWVTGESATSKVIYGRTNAVNQMATVIGYSDQHRVLLADLIPEETYYFYVISEDRAGNATTNTLDGTYYRFVAPRPASALLVYTPESLFAEGGLLSDSPYPGIETWIGVLDELGIDYEVWDVGEQSRTPLLEELKAYRTVLWRPEELTAPSPGFLTALNGYVKGGGGLFVSSFDLPTRLKEMNQTNFLGEVLHVASAQEDLGATVLSGVPGDPIGGGIQVDLDYSEFPSGLVIELLGIVWENGPDHLTARADAAPVFLEETGRTVGVRYPRTGADSAGRVVYLSVSLESIPYTTAAPNNRTTILDNALRFLSPELVGGSSLAFDASAYTVPASVVLEVTDSARANAASVRVAITNGTQSMLLDLPRAPKSGIFRGQLILDPTQSNTGGGVPRLLAAHGDLLTAVYVDSANRTIRAQAGVDVVRPKIAEVLFEPAYSECVITWTTDKPTDALVRFGESRGDDSFLTRSSYSGELGTSHEIVLSGLVPDHRYFFIVTSRDAAGNVTTDNRGGKMYTFRTLKPLVTPWRDTLERGHNGWAVFNDDGGTGAIIGDEDDGGDLAALGWDFGIPENQHGVSALSGDNVWATNLKGQPVDFAITDLISPVISLVGGNHATLRFFQNYNFTSEGGVDEEGDPFGDFVVEAGQVALTTDNGTTWKDLYVVDQEVSEDWEEIEVDISKYVGNVVRIRFNYQLFAFNTTDRLGWLLDDFSIEMNSVAASSVRVESSLSQASFVLSDKNDIAIAGVGRSLVTNVPPGVYVVTWNPIPFFTTPPPQTNTLGANLQLTFTGNYTFPDLNANGVPDGWEQQVLGGLIPANDPDRDGDRDGATDAEEFAQGTDPLKADSVLRIQGPITLPNRTVRFEWPTVVGREYQLEVSNDLQTWQSAGDVLRGDGQVQGTNLSALDKRLHYYFRVHVVP